MTRLTIIMPTYNGERFLRPQIDSILAQSAPDFELLTIDDGSTDTSVAIIDEYARCDKRVRRLQSTGNRGQRTRLRELVEASSTEFLAIADQDDIWHPERNARLLHGIGDRAVAFGRSSLIDADGTDLGQSVHDALQLRPDIGPLESLFHPLLSAHAAIVRRAWMDLAAFHGWLSFDRLMGIEALFSLGMVYLDEAIVHHRIHDSNQNNGSVLKRPGSRRMISRQRAQLSFGFLALDRMEFYLTVDQLSRSIALPRKTAQLFGRLSGACYNAWYQRADTRKASGRWLAAYVVEQLASHAASDRDLAVLKRAMKSLSRPQLGPTNLVNAARRYFIA